MKKKVFIIVNSLILVVVQAILELGNDILRNLGVEDRIDDIGVFFGWVFNHARLPL